VNKNLSNDIIKISPSLYFQHEDLYTEYFFSSCNERKENNNDGKKSQKELQAIQRLLPLTGERQRRFIHAENEQFIVDFQVDVTMVSDYCHLFIKEIIMNVKFKLRFNEN